MDGKKINQNPMQMPTWSLGMAMAWIACREISSASELWRAGLESAWFTDENLSPNHAFLDAETTLKNALVEGSIVATGLLGGERVGVPVLAWEDMEISYGFASDDSLMHRATNAAGAMYTDLRVNRTDILGRWPADQALVPGKRRRGRKAEKLEEVKRNMAEYNNAHGDLATMKETAMEEQFKASRDTCRKARDQVLGVVAN